MNPVEHVNALLKHLVEKDCPDTVAALIESIKNAISRIEPCKLLGSFEHCIRLSHQEAASLD